MGFFLLGLVLFFSVHCISIFSESWRNKMAENLGEWLWKGYYSLVSLIGFILMVRGFVNVRFSSENIYSFPTWMTHVTMLLMVPVFPLLLATYLPGKISRAIKNPMLLATIIWAFSHLLSNGRGADLILFGSFLTWALIDLFSMRKRDQRKLPSAPESKVNDLFSVIGGMVLYGLFWVWLHELITGIPLIG